MANQTAIIPLRIKRPVLAPRPTRRIGDGVFRVIVQMAYEMDASERVCPGEYEEGMCWLKKNLPIVKEQIARFLRMRKPPPAFIAKNFNQYFSDWYKQKYRGDEILLYQHFNYHSPDYRALACLTIAVKLEGKKAFLVVDGTFWCYRWRLRDDVVKVITVPLTESCSVIERSIVKMLRSLNPYPDFVYPDFGYPPIEEC